MAIAGSVSAADDCLIRCLSNTNMAWVRVTTRSPAVSEGTVRPETAGLTLEVVRLGLEQAIMDWVRTSISLITFGFTLYKFFQIEPGRGEEPHRLVSARGFAIALIAL